MNRVWTALLLIATVFVAGAVVYVLAHNDKVADAGQIPSIATSPSTSGAGQSSSSGGSSTSGSSTPAGPKTVVFLGDDWTLGVGTSATTRRFANLLGADLHVKAIIVAAAGAGYAKKGPSGDSYVELASKVAAYHPYMIVVSGGRNDLTDDPNTLKTAAKTVFTELRSGAPTARIVAVAPFWGDSDAPKPLDSVAAAVKSGVGGTVRGTYLDVPDPIHGKSSDMASNNADPNDAGNAAIAAALASDLHTAFVSPIPTAAPTSAASSSHKSGHKSGH